MPQRLWKNSDFDPLLNPYLALIENAPIGIFQSCLTTHRFLNVNPAMARILGHPDPDQCIDTISHISQIYVDSRDRDHFLETIREQGALLNFESRFLRRDGTRIHGKIHARIARDSQGRDTFLEGFFEDVTEAREAAHSLAQREETYRLIFKNTGTGAIIVEEDMEISLVNDEFLRLTGYDRGELEGREKWPCIVAHPGDLERMTAYHTHRRRPDGEAPKAYEFTLKTKDGRHKNTRVRVDLIPGTGKSIASFVDIHDQKQAEAEMRRRHAHLDKENQRLKAAMKDRTSFCGIIGKSPSMQKVFDLILRAGLTDSNVIIYGESGTGKELVAHAIHTMSDRANHRFVPVHCGAIPSHLLESEFFGHKKGAFTGALRDTPGFLDHAARGTLFLDELGEIDTQIQVKLLRILEGNGYTPVGGRDVKTTDVRIIAATNRNLNDLVRQGKMREDFFYRIHIIPIYIPPLRERLEDIPLLVDHFMEKYGNTGRRLPPHMMNSLMRHHWPGNVRELENTLQRLVNLEETEFVATPSAVPPSVPAAAPAPEPSTGDPRLSTVLEEFERSHITRVLESRNWNRKATAQALGIGRKTLYLKMKRLGIEDSNDVGQILPVG